MHSQLAFSKRASLSCPTTHLAALEDSSVTGCCDCGPVLRCSENSKIQMDRTFVAKKSGRRRILQKLADRLELTIDECPLTDQANAVTVIGIVRTVDGAQRLNGLARPASPTDCSLPHLFCRPRRVILTGRPRCAPDPQSCGYGSNSIPSTSSVGRPAEAAGSGDSGTEDS